MYKVKVGGKEVELTEVRVSAIPFNRVWPGKQRDISQSEIAYVLHIEEYESVDISITNIGLVENCTIRPKSKKIFADINEKRIDFRLEKHGHYVAEINGTHHAIHIFYEKPEEYESTDATYSFKSGEHKIGKLELNDNESVYIGKDAVLYANIFAVGKKNIKIFGHGMLNGSLEVRTEQSGDIGYDGEQSFSKEKLNTIGCIRLIECEDIFIDGVTVTDSSSYVISVYAGENIIINNVKVVGHWKYNNDGIDLINCSNAVIKNSFIRSFDDTICIKGFTAFSQKNCEKITVDNCILWCGWGKTLEIGVATAAKKINGITFSNCDLIHNGSICVSIHNGQFADISNVLYKNINIEYDYIDKPVYQSSDDMEYVNGGQILPELILITDKRRSWQGNISTPDEKRSIKNVCFENLNVICEEKIKPIMGVNMVNEYGEFDNIKINSLNINNKMIENIDLLRYNDFDNLILK